MGLWLGWIGATLALGAGCWVAAARRPRLGAAMVGVVLALLCAKAVLHALPHVEQALFPWPGYVYVQRIVLYPLGVAFFGAAVPRLAVRWNRLVVAFVALGVLAHGARDSAWMAWPERHGVVAFADARGHLRQSAHYTCGPAACVSAVWYRGVRISERDMARLCLTRRGGSRLFDLYRGIVLALGRHAAGVRIADLAAAELLVEGRVAVTANRGGGHALCIVGRGDRAVVHDPLQADPQEWTLETLRANYRGPAVVLPAP